MGYFGSWLPTTVGVVAMVMLVQNVAVAKTAREVNQIAQAITVKIAVGGDNGSGILLQKNGDVYTVLTAAHVVKGRAESQLTITTNDDQKHQVVAGSVRKYQGDVDVAIVKFRSSKTYKLAELGDSNKLEGGMDIYVAGFPAPTRVITESVFVFREGKVTANSKRAFKNGYGLLYSNDTLPGMSGGPVLNEAGKVVGIHGKGDREETTGAKTGFNAGIPIARFADVSGGLGVETGIAVARTVQNAALTADDYFVSAYQKNEQGNYRESLSDYDRVIALKPDYAEAYINRGTLKHEKLNDPQGALADFNRAVTLKPDLAEAYSNRGALKYERLNDPQGALADFNRAITLKPNYAEAYSNRGNLKSQKLNDLSGALKDFSYAIKLNPELVNGYYNRGDLLYTVGRKAEALQDFRKVRDVAPTGLAGLVATGIIAMEQGQLEAIASLNQAIAVNPQFADAFKYLGLVYRRQGNTAQAIRNWRKAAHLCKANGSDRDYRILQGWLQELGVKI